MALLLRTILISAFLLTGLPAHAQDNYTLIVEKNLFSPLRKKWESPPKATASSKPVLTKAMLPVLKGTVITKNSRRAVLAFGKPAHQPSPQPPRPARRARGKKTPAPAPTQQVTPRIGNTSIVSQGDSINYFRLVAVEDKNVTLEYEGEKITIYQQ